jgi:hypothetical protein
MGAVAFHQRKPARSRAGFLFAAGMSAASMESLAPPALRPHATWPACLRVLAFAVSMAALAPLHAQVRETGDYLARMDADRDGRVSLAEYQDWLSYAFDAMDRDRDGTLVPGELPGGRGTAVTRIAHRARLAATFRKQDANRDGFLDARELAAPPR